MTAGILWSATALLVAAGAAIAVPTTLLAGPASLLTVASALLALGAITLLAMVIVTLPRREAYEGAGPIDHLPAVIAWPVRFGWWIGGLAVGLAQLGMLVTTPGGGSVTTNSRFALCIMAVFGMVATLFAAHALPGAAMVALFALWGAVIAIALMRGIVGMIARLSRA
ncbi:hypothetical protein [Microbacterium sp. 179-I 3D3 NHS]|uniref:hypothetical protein n=1 Tax=unclassified Microbacterium TaxID=2609290 RepID=UPI0039A0CB44